MFFYKQFIGVKTIIITKDGYFNVTYQTTVFWLQVWSKLLSTIYLLYKAITKQLTFTCTYVAILLIGLTCIIIITCIHVHVFYMHVVFTKMLLTSYTRVLYVHFSQYTVTELQQQYNVLLLMNIGKFF